MPEAFKIGDYSDTYGTANFSFFSNGQNNPQNYRFAGITQKEISEMSFSQIHWWKDTPGIKPRILEFGGEFFGSNALIALRALGKEIRGTGIKKFWLDSTHFVLGTGGQLLSSKNTVKQGFIPYTGNFLCVSPFVYSETENSESWSVTTNNSWTNNGSSSNNTGTGNAHVLEIHVLNVAGNNEPIIQVDVRDDTSGNVVTWNYDGTNGIDPGSTLILYLVTRVGSDPFAFVQKGQALLDGVRSGGVDISGLVDNIDWLKISAGGTQTFGARLVWNSSDPNPNGATVTFKWREADQD